RRREISVKSDDVYLSEAERLLRGIARANALIPPRLIYSRIPLLRYLFEYAKHPDNRAAASSVFLVYLVIMVGFQYFTILRAETDRHDALNKLELAAKERANNRLADSRQYFAAQTIDQLLKDNKVELARLVAVKAIEDTAPRAPQADL